MTADLAQLRDLRERLARATGPDRDLDARIATALDLRPEWAASIKGRLVANHVSKLSLDAGHVSVGKNGPGWAAEPVTASIDAVLAIVTQVKPCGSVGLELIIFDELIRGAQATVGDNIFEEARTAPLAILKALCSALIAEMEAVDA